MSYYSIVHSHWNAPSSALSNALLLTPRILYPEECGCNALDSSNPDFASHVSAASNIGCISVYSQQLLDLLSSPSRRHFGSIERGLQNVLDVSDITQAERNLLYIRVNEIIRKKPTSRRRIQKGGELNAEYAQGLIREKEKKRSEKYTNRLALARTRTKNRVKRELNQLGVINRRLERSRVKTLKQVLPNDLGASHLTIPIPDPEKTANWEQIFAEIESTIPEGFGLETGDPETMFEDRPVELVEPEPMVQPSSGWLQDDFVAFEDSSSSASSDDSVFHSSP